MSLAYALNITSEAASPYTDSSAFHVPSVTDEYQTLVLIAPIVIEAVQCIAAYSGKVDASFHAKEYLYEEYRCMLQWAAKVSGETAVSCDQGSQPGSGLTE